MSTMLRVMASAQRLRTFRTLRSNHSVAASALVPAGMMVIDTAPLGTPHHGVPLGLQRRHYFDFPFRRPQNSGKATTSKTADTFDFFNPTTTDPDDNMWGFRWSSKSDLENYREGYPDVADNPRKRMNQEFYSGKIACIPDGMTLDQLHDKWFGNIRILEYGHSYIQWLFPIQEQGMNSAAQPMQKGEIEWFLRMTKGVRLGGAPTEGGAAAAAPLQASPTQAERHPEEPAEEGSDDNVAIGSKRPRPTAPTKEGAPAGGDVAGIKVWKRVVQSYAMMMDFWGFDLVDPDTGAVVSKASKLGPPVNKDGAPAKKLRTTEEFSNLQYSSHNYLRITRMLKFFGELQRPLFQQNILMAFEKEIYETKLLSNCRSSFEDYWIGTIKDDSVRAEWMARIKAHKSSSPPKRGWSKYDEDEEDYEVAAPSGVGKKENTTSSTTAMASASSDTTMPGDATVPMALSETTTTTASLPAADVPVAEAAPQRDATLNVSDTPPSAAAEPKSEKTD